MRTDGQTERHDEANSRFSQFCEHNQKLPKRWGNLTYRRPHSVTQYQTCLKRKLMPITVISKDLQTVGSFLDMPPLKFDF
jgi:hypothetical protein